MKNNSSKSPERKNFIAQLGGQLEQLGKLNLMNFDDEEEENKGKGSSKSEKKKEILINILESMKYSSVENFFKRAISYKKFFNQFSNKTFTMKENVDISYEIQIKSLICDIFSYVFSLREDFLLDNFFQYFHHLYRARVHLLFSFGAASY